MAAQLGRTLALQIDTTGGGSYSTIASIRTKSLKIAERSGRRHDRRLGEPVARAPGKCRG